MTAPKPTVQNLQSQLASFSNREIAITDLSDTMQTDHKPKYRESLVQGFERIVNGFNVMMRPPVLRQFYRRVDLLARDYLIGVENLPAASNALDCDDGVCGFAKDLNPFVLRQAYDSGLSLTTLGHGFGALIWVCPPLRYLLSCADLSDTLNLEIVQGSNFIADDDTSSHDIIDLCQGTASQLSGMANQPMTPKLKAQFASLKTLKALRHFCIKDEDGKIAACGFGVLCGDIVVLEGAYAINARALAFGLKHFARTMLKDGITNLEWRNPDPRVFAHASRIGSWQAVGRTEFLKRLNQGQMLKKLLDQNQKKAAKAA